jgi:hypothetical protein
MLKRSVFASIDAIRGALAELGAVAESADAQIAQA